jgi:oxalate decarboxylase/phosphoglucose isomerase-like protein (cupin superfamily)
MRTRFVVTTLTVAACSAVAYTAGAAQRQSSPTAVREALAQAVSPSGARGETLGLSRVVIPPKAQLALHVHPGTQIAYVDKGTLTYTVKTGAVNVYRGEADKQPRLVRRITAGHTAKVRAGQWLIEKPHVQHFGANLSGSPIVILAATLLRNGQPPAIPIQG